MENNDYRHMETSDHDFTEKPVIIIERVDEDDDSRVITIKADGRHTRTKRGLKIAISSLATLLIVLLAWWAYGYYCRYIDIGVPVSRKPKENIDMLSRQPHRGQQPEVRVSHDSILGVAMDYYELRGLCGEVSMTEPDTADTSVIFYSRCADYSPELQPIGSMVIGGRRVQDDDSRLGYCAMLGTETIVGVGRWEDVRDYCEEKGGSFFRQYVLVSKGVLPPNFELHGKVERRALARTVDDRLYYIQTHNPEVMTAFADALRESGFVDAIYITGGTDYCFYRTPDLVRHDIGDPARYPHKKNAGAVPWMIFRKPVKK